MNARERKILNLGFDAGWNAHEAYLACTPDAAGPWFVMPGSTPIPGVNIDLQTSASTTAAEPQVAPAETQGLRTPVDEATATTEPGDVDRVQRSPVSGHVFRVDVEDIFCDCGTDLRGSHHRDCPAVNEWLAPVRQRVESGFGEAWDRAVDYAAACVDDEAREANPYPRQLDDDARDTA